ncbi:hypothetical protein DFO58_2467 [Arthrobacter sp. AG1021]|nr:hypothetical protein DFO58_2467 [Arthrobacter sp. AG1021]
MSRHAAVHDADGTYLEHCAWFGWYEVSTNPAACKHS